MIVCACVCVCVCVCACVRVLTPPTNIIPFSACSFSRYFRYHIPNFSH